MTRSGYRRAIAALLAVALAPGLAAADTRAHSETPDAVPGEDEVLYSCKNHVGAVAITLKPETELKDLLTWVMGFTCKDFVFDPYIKSKKVTLIVPNTMTAPEAYRVFLAALSTIGLTVVQKGKLLHIVDAHLAKTETLPIYKTGLPDDADQVVRYVLKPSYAGGDTLLAAFNALKSDVGDVQLVGSLLMMTDYGSHVRDMVSIAKMIDVPGGSDGIYTIPILHADAAKLSEKISQLLGIATTASPRAGAPGKGTPPDDGHASSSNVPTKLLVDERTNTLIVAGSPAGYQRVKALAERLDIVLDIEGGASIHVFHLGSAVAEDLAKTLNDTISGAKQTKAGAVGGPPAAAPPAMGGPEGVGASLEGQVHVTSDSLTNSLIVMSSGRDYLAIKDVIKELDQPRRQVFIETLILEVDTSNDLEFGTSSHGALPVSNGNAVAIGGVQTPQLSSLNLASLTTASGLIGGLIGSPLANSTTLLGASIPSYGILFQALLNNANTISKKTPSFIGLDNKKIHWSSGIDIPYKKGVLPTATTASPLTGALTTNIDRQKLDLVLDITPHISGDDKVLLEIKHSSMDLGPDQADLGPTWTRQEFESSFVVHDQETIVLEGFNQEREIDSATKVPILGDIPLIGYLFKYTSKVKKKSNLLIMLTPYIVKDQMDLQSIKERKMHEHDEFVKSFMVLDGMKYIPAIDYRRKRGVVEEINRSLQSVEEDVAARNAIIRAKPVDQGVIEYAEPKP